jgi:hypothetical protein
MPGSPTIPFERWPIALGLTGFIAGFLGPIVLNPDANQGPMLGLFITGPGGAIAGLVLGLAFRVLPFAESVQKKALIMVCAALGLGTLYFSLPEPVLVGYVIEADVADCTLPTEAAATAATTWQQAVDHSSYSPPADWKQIALRNVAEADGVVLTMRIAQRVMIYQQRKPWNSGRRIASAWQPVDASERYYAIDAGNDCRAYLDRPRQRYTPFTTGPSNPNRPAEEWPPTDTTSFLQLMELGPVPADYRRLLDDQQR